jgi:pimeloyl-ACP methyl ester carboxylesterase
MNTLQDYADINGARIYYESAGEGDPVVLLHAGVANSGMWDEVFTALASTHRVIRYDRRGYGRSLMPVGDYAHIDDLRGLLDHLGVARAHLVGCSDGGRVVLEFALDAPEHARTLILSGASLRGYEYSDVVTSYAQQNDDAFASGNIARAVDLDMQMWVVGPKRRAATLDPAFLARARAMAEDVYKTPPTLGDERPLSPPALNRLWQIKTPALVMVGANDAPDILNVSGMIAFALDRAEKLMIPNAGHLLPMEDPTTFIQHFLAFIKLSSIMEG